MLLVSLAEKRGLYTKYSLASAVVYIPGGSTVVQRDAYEYNKARKFRMYRSFTGSNEGCSRSLDSGRAGERRRKNFISDRYLKKLEEEGFVKKLFGR